MKVVYECIQVIRSLESMWKVLYILSHKIVKINYKTSKMKHRSHKYLPVAVYFIYYQAWLKKNIRATCITCIEIVGFQKKTEYEKTVVKTT